MLGMLSGSRRRRHGRAARRARASPSSTAARRTHRARCRRARSPTRFAVTAAVGLRAPERHRRHWRTRASARPTTTSSSSPGSLYLVAEVRGEVLHVAVSAPRARTGRFLRRGQNAGHREARRRRARSHRRDHRAPRGASGCASSRRSFAPSTRETAARHYAEHEGKPFYDGLVTFITAGPSLVMVVEGPDDTWKVVRTLMGATEPARRRARDDSRRPRRSRSQQNLVHGSDSAESAPREIAIFFPHLA